MSSPQPHLQGSKPDHPFQVLDDGVAMAESARCLFCHDAPCSRACPAGIDVSGFIRRIKVGNPARAGRMIRERNAVSAACSWVCAAEMFCQKGCLASGIERPVQIRALHRYAADLEIRQGIRKPQPGELRPERVAVVGAGPAGLGCAWELLARGYRVAVHERLEAAGGLLAYGIGPHKLPRAVLSQELAALAEAGLAVETGREICDPAAAGELLQQGFAAVFVAAGLVNPIRLGLPGGEPRGLYAAAPLLAALNGPGGSGVLETPAQAAVVIGGGNTALETARTLYRVGVPRITVLSLEGEEEMPAFPAEIAAAKRDGIRFMARRRAVRLISRDGCLRGLEIEQIRWRVPGDLRPANAEGIPGTGEEIEADLVVEAVGQAPAGPWRDSFRRVHAGPAAAPSGPPSGSPAVSPLSTELESGAAGPGPLSWQLQPGIFSGGDLQGAASVPEATRHGREAAAAIDFYLRSRVGGTTRQ